MPDVSLYKIKVALKQLMNSEIPGEDGSTSKLLKEPQYFG